MRHTRLPLDQAAQPAEDERAAGPRRERYASPGGGRIAIGALLGLAFIAAHAGDAARGKALIERREAANCLLCHAIPGVRGDSGNVGPSLAGIGRRATRASLAAQISDPTRFKADATMPPYYRTRGLVRVAPEYRDKPILSLEEIDDVVEYLLTLR